MPLRARALSFAGCSVSRIFKFAEEQIRRVFDDNLGIIFHISP